MSNKHEHKKEKKMELVTIHLSLPYNCAKVTAICMEKIMNHPNFHNHGQKALMSGKFLTLENFTKAEVRNFMETMAFDENCQSIIGARWKTDVDRNGVSDKSDVFHHRLKGSLQVLENIHTGLFDITNFINEWNRREGDVIDAESFIFTSLSRYSDCFTEIDGNWWSDKQGMVAVATELDPEMHVPASEVFKVCGEETEELKALHANCAEMDESEYYLKQIRQHRKENGTDNQ